MGRGLAAPQIGSNESVFVTYVDNKIEIFINPKIIDKSSTENYYKEVCISSSIVAADVKRPDWIVMEWIDKDGKARSEKFEEFKARLYQHEEAHLRGRLNIDDCIDDGIEFVTFDALKEKLRPSRK